MTVLVDVRCVLDEGLGVGNRDPVGLHFGVGQRDEGLLQYKQPGAHRQPLRSAGLIIRVYLAGGANLLTVRAIHILALYSVNLILAQHSINSFSLMPQRPGGPRATYETRHLYLRGFETEDTSGNT